jgi:hypothetical protein
MNLILIAWLLKNIKLGLEKLKKNMAKMELLKKKRKKKATIKVNF